MISLIVCLFIFIYTGLMILPMIAGAFLLAFFIGYSLWLWIKRPRNIVINPWLSDMSGLFTLYFMVVALIKNAGQWWYITPVVCATIVLFISLIRPKDESFEI